MSRSPPTSSRHIKSHTLLLKNDCSASSLKSWPGQFINFETVR
ncbi:Uncharacterized protein APZ42_013157 [Daphnia magna]|uniref:Uncharacterized protein n=1 Tax=Daphnia magna TaxID=35525 RepID=A0A162R1V5_9CRUS|nr:Uncharacterized protein APZ42_013157 [Daphnia magna]